MQWMKAYWPKIKKLALRGNTRILDSDYDDNDFDQLDRMSLEETKEKLEWRKRAFEYEQNNSYEIEI